MAKIKKPKFVKGVAASANNLYWKIPDIGKETLKSMLIGYLTDVMTANGYNYTLVFELRSEKFKAVLLK